MNPAIGYAHFQLSGGLKALVRWTVGFTALALGGLGVYARYGGGGTRAAAASSINVTLGIIAVLLVFVVGGRVGSALKLDASLDMARSHRLMPLSPASAVLGYLLGPTLPTLAVVAIASLFTAFGYVAGGYDLPALFVALALIASTGLLLAMLNTVGSIGNKGGGIGWVWGVGLGALFGTYGKVFVAVPWTATIAAPASGRTVFNLRTVEALTVGHAVGIAMHAALALLLFVAACRRWARPDRPAFSTTLWLALIALVVAGTLAGVGWSADLRPFNSDYFTPEPGITLPASIAVLLLLCHGPILAAEKQSLAHRVRVNVADPAADEDKPRIPPWLAAVFAGALLLPLALLRPAASPEDFESLALVVGPSGVEPGFVQQQLLDALRPQAWLVTAACVLAGLATAWALVRLLTRLRAGWAYFWIYLAMWAVPVALAAGLVAWETGELEQPLSGLSAFGLPGALLVAWNGADASAWPGVAFQAVVALVLVLLALRAPDRAAKPATRE